VSASTVEQAHPDGHAAHDPVPGQRLGVMLLILADAAFVLSLVFTYFYLRGLNTEGGWIPAGSHTLNPLNGWVIAGVMVLSALAYRWGELGVPAGDRRRVTAGVVLALLLVVVDLGLQLARLVTLPFGAGTGSYASTVIVMAGSHLVHLLITAVLGIAIWNRSRMGLFADNPWQIRLVGYWWTWVAVSAVLLAIATSFA